MGVLLLFLFDLAQAITSPSQSTAPGLSPSAPTVVESLQAAVAELSRSSKSDVKKIAGAIGRDLETIKTANRADSLPPAYVGSLADDAGALANLARRTEINPKAMTLLEGIAEDIQIKASVIAAQQTSSSPTGPRPGSAEVVVQSPPAGLGQSKPLPMPQAPKKWLPAPGHAKPEGGTSASAQMAVPMRTLDVPPPRHDGGNQRALRIDEYTIRPANYPISIQRAPSPPAKVAPAPTAPAPLSPGRAGELAVEIVTVDAQNREIDNIVVYFTGFEILTRFSTQEDRIASRYLRPLGTTRLNRPLPHGVYYLVAIAGALPNEINTNLLQPELIGPGRVRPIKLLAR